MKREIVLGALATAMAPGNRSDANAGFLLGAASPMTSAVPFSPRKDGREDRRKMFASRVESNPYRRLN